MHVHPPATSILSPLGAGRNQASKKFLIFLAPQRGGLECFGMIRSMAISSSISWYVIRLEVLDLFWDHVGWFWSIAGMVNSLLSALYGQCFCSDFASCFTVHIFSWLSRTQLSDDPNYPLLIQHCYWKWPFTVTCPFKMVIFHSYVTLPDGKWNPSETSFPADQSLCFLGSASSGPHMDD